MFRRLGGSEQHEETQRGSNAGQARILALQPYDNQESGTQRGHCRSGTDLQRSGCGSALSLVV